MILITPHLFLDDDSRVKLEMRDGSDYINASFVKVLQNSQVMVSVRLQFKLYVKSYRFNIYRLNSDFAKLISCEEKF